MIFEDVNYAMGNIAEIGCLALLYLGNNGQVILEIIEVWIYEARTSIYRWTTVSE